MEPSPRLYLCAYCHQQVKICRKCDHGNIYCSPVCAMVARFTSLKLAGARYQATFNGKRHHAMRQARYRKAHSKKVTHQGSLFSAQNAPIRLPENPVNTESGQESPGFFCSFCKKPVSSWLRNDFLRRRSHKKLTGLKACPQAP